MYEPLLGLSWQYINSSGQLKIVAKIAIELSANEGVNISVSSIIRETCVITLNVINGSNNTPLNQAINYTSIGANLDTTPVVRSAIATVPAITVRVFVFKNSVLQDESAGVTNSNSQIVIQ